MFVMINKDWGGGQFLDFMEGHSCYEGGHRAHRGVAPLGKTLDCILRYVQQYRFADMIINSMTKMRFIGAKS